MSIGDFIRTFQTEIITSSIFIVISIALLTFLAIAQSKEKRGRKSIIGGILSVVAIVVGITVLLSIQEKTVIINDEPVIKKIEFFEILMVDFIFIIVYTIISFIMLKTHKHGKSKEKMTTKKVALLGVLIGFASVLMLAGIPIMPAAPYLKLEISSLIIFMVLIWFDFKSAILVSLATNLIHVFMPSLTAPVIPFLDEGINFIATMSFLIPSVLLLNTKEDAEKPSYKKVLLATGIGVAFTTIFMVSYNAFINLPIIYRFEMPFKDVLAIFGIFNIAKWGASFLIINLLWRKLYDLKDIRNQE
jgi:riboflavin transporter FmnP